MGDGLDDLGDCDVLQEVEGKVLGCEGPAETVEFVDEVADKEAHLFDVGMEGVEDDETIVVFALKDQLVLPVVGAAQHAHAEIEAVVFVAALAAATAIVAL